MPSNQQQMAKRTKTFFLNMKKQNIGTALKISSDGVPSSVRNVKSGKLC